MFLLKLYVKRESERDRKERLIEKRVVEKREEDCEELCTSILQYIVCTYNKCTVIFP